MATGLDGFGPAEEFTVEDLERMPDDGLRYELLDGMLLVSPAPGVWHQEVAFALARALHAACPPELHVVIAPFEWRGSRRTALQPDVLVARRGSHDLLNGAGQDVVGDVVDPLAGGGPVNPGCYGAAATAGAPACWCCPGGP
ncbi:MAG: Uma2 family endonuclease [Pseudonocardiaceae bacterium]